MVGIGKPSIYNRPPIMEERDIQEEQTNKRVRELTLEEM